MSKIKVKSLFRYPRFINKWYANFWGYFWLPCDICGRPFGGHESDEVLKVTQAYGHMVCWRCSDEARKRNAVLLAELYEDSK